MTQTTPSKANGSHTPHIPGLVTEYPPAPLPTPRYAPKCGVSVIVLSYNEEDNIERSLRSLLHVSDDIWLIDSQSTDNTVEIAKSIGVNVVVRPWPGFPQQWNFGFTELPLRYPYAMVHASDEQLPEAWLQEFQQTLDQPNPPDMILTRFRFWWMGKPIKHGKMGQTYIVKAGKRELMLYNDRSCNEHIPLQGTVYKMNERYEHRDAKETLRWIHKHIGYAQLEANERRKARDKSERIGKLFGAGQAARVQWIRENVFDRLPPIARPTAYLAYKMVLGQGWRDGLSGTMFHILHGFWFPLMIDLFELEETLRKEGKL